VVGAATVGSITMPHKRNPESSEHLDTLARVARAAAGLLAEAMVGAHERDGRTWKSEWFALPEVTLAAGTAAALAADLVEGLVVHPDRMRANLEARGRDWASEQVLAQLARQLGKHRAQELMRQALTASAPTAATDTPDLVAAITALDVADPADVARWVAAPATGAAGAMVDAVTARGTPEGVG
jgi:adenylosuccinate lyase